ncbi:MAG: hypothetical protein GQ559_12520 [Desulfobulbaceae bacterium]|nr:hypothetical protein [Desulfobulbaceae bacterium]
MSCDNPAGLYHRQYFLWLLTCLWFAAPALLHAADDFSFEIEKFEKKPLEWGGYIELEWEHMDVNQGSAFSLLNLYDDPKSTLDRLTGSLKLDGSYVKGIVSFNWLLKAVGRQDEFGWVDFADVYEAYASIKPSPFITSGLGKKSYKWGKGYAWNPVGFINRLKDPNNPEKALEGYITAEADLIKSFSGPLQTAAFTTVVLPVRQDINEDFGVVDNVNLAAKMYLLYRDIDIDFLIYSGNSRTTRFGFDFATNITTNFEIHGELAYIPSLNKFVLLDHGSLATREISATSYLLGLRYLSESDITSIIEYYHNGGGYSESELDRFFQLLDDGAVQYDGTGVDALIQKARNVSLRGYGRPNPGRNYLYAKFTKKEPFDILYFTPGLTAIINLDDFSSSITPELVYTGFTNWQLRLRFSLLSGGGSTEYGEKLNSNKLELRVRYFF